LEHRATYPRDKHVICPICPGDWSVSDKGKAKREHRHTDVHTETWGLRPDEWKAAFSVWEPLPKRASGSPSFLTPLIETIAVDDDAVVIAGSVQASIATPAVSIPVLKKSVVHQQHNSSKRKADEGPVDVDFTVGQVASTSGRDMHMIRKRPRTEDGDTPCKESPEVLEKNAAEASGAQSQLSLSDVNGSLAHPSPGLSHESLINKSEHEDDDEFNDWEEVKVLPLIEDLTRPAKHSPIHNLPLTLLVNTLKTPEDLAEAASLLDSRGEANVHGDSNTVNGEGPDQEAESEKNFIDQFWDEVSDSHNDPSSESDSESDSD
jgi:hypothetical protein